MNEWCLFRDSIYNQYKTDIKFNFFTIYYYPVVLPKEPSSVTIPLLSNIFETLKMSNATYTLLYVDPDYVSYCENGYRYLKWICCVMRLGDSSCCIYTYKYLIVMRTHLNVKNIKFFINWWGMVIILSLRNCSNSSSLQSFQSLYFTFYVQIPIVIHHKSIYICRGEQGLWYSVLNSVVGKVCFVEWIAYIPLDILPLQAASW